MNQQNSLIGNQALYLCFTAWEKIPLDWEAQDSDAIYVNQYSSKILYEIWILVACYIEFPSSELSGLRVAMRGFPWWRKPDLE